MVDLNGFSHYTVLVFAQLLTCVSAQDRNCQYTAMVRHGDSPAISRQCISAEEAALLRQAVRERAGRRTFPGSSFPQPSAGSSLPSSSSGIPQPRFDPARSNAGPVIRDMFPGLNPGSGTFTRAGSSGGFPASSSGIDPSVLDSASRGTFPASSGVRRSGAGIPDWLSAGSGQPRLPAGSRTPGAGTGTTDWLRTRPGQPTGVPVGDRFDLSRTGRGSLPTPGAGRSGVGTLDWIRSGSRSTGGSLRMPGGPEPRTENIVPPNTRRTPGETFIPPAVPDPSASGQRVSTGQGAEASLIMVDATGPYYNFYAYPDSQPIRVDVTPPRTETEPPLFCSRKTPTDTQCTEQCRADSACPTNYKCCPVGCSLDCVEARAGTVPLP